MSGTVNRRSFLKSGALAGSAAVAAGWPGGAVRAHDAPARAYQNGLSPWPLALNTSTIRPASFEEKIQATVDAGFDAIEPWVNELEEYEAAGGNLEDLGKRFKDLGLMVPNVIGLWSCMPATPDEFEASLEATRNRMRMSSAIGSKHVAAIPAPDREDFDLKWGAEMYRRLLDIGRKDYNIIVAFEFVGFLKGVHRLGQACAIALDADDRDACLVSDTFHLFRGGSGFNGLKHLDGDFIANFHWNDVPGDKPREEQGDADRLYPGDGILPLTQVIQDLVTIGYRGALSLELFNRAHWEQPPLEVAKTGIEKMRAGIQRALEQA